MGDSAGGQAWSASVACRLSAWLMRVSRRVAGRFSRGREAHNGVAAGEAGEVGREVEGAGDGAGRAVGVGGVCVVGGGDPEVDPGEAELEAPEQGGQVASGRAVELARAQARGGGVEGDMPEALAGGPLDGGAGVAAGGRAERGEGQAERGAVEHAGY